MDACTLEPPGKYDGLICVRAALTRKLRKTDESIEMSFGVELKGRGGKNPHMDGMHFGRLATLAAMSPYAKLLRSLATVHPNL